MYARAVLVILLIAMVCRSNAVPSYFLDFGLHIDTILDRTVDGSSGQIDLNCYFNIFSSVFDKVWVNNNGILSFEYDFGDYVPMLFPMGSTLIAPYWSDVDTRDFVGPGAVYYRETTDPADLDRIEQDVKAALENVLGEYCPTWAFVATWDNVTFYGGTPYSSRNTFQVVLVQDAYDRAVTYFNYDQLTWTTSLDPNNNGLGAVAGYEAKNEHFLNLPGSQTQGILSLQYTSNVGIPGRWFFPLCNNCTEPPVECFTCDWTSGNPNDPIGVVEQLCNDQANKTTCAEGEVCLTRLKCNDEHIPRPGQSTSGAQIIYRLKKECASPNKCDPESWLDGYLYKTAQKNLVVSKCCATCGCCNEQHGEDIDFVFGDTNPAAPVEHFGQGFGNGRYFCSF